MVRRQFCPVGPRRPGSVVRVTAAPAVVQAPARTQKAVGKRKAAPNRRAAPTGRKVVAKMEKAPTTPP